MSTSATSATATAPDSRTVPQAASFWVPPSERPPTDEEEKRARKRTLEVNNETEIGYDKETDFYSPWRQSYEKIEHYKKLDNHNRDNRWEFREDVNVGQDCDRQLKLKTAFGIATQLGLSDFHTQVVVDKLFEIDGRRFGQRTEAVVFCLCAIVVNEDAQGRYGAEKVYHPARKDSNNDEEFVRVKDQLEGAFGPITESRLHSIYAKLTQGQPPERTGERTRQFVRNNTKVQRHPSFTPDHALPKPTGES